MKKITIPALMLAVAMVATGCKKADDNPNMGPAQEAGAAIDNAGANTAAAAREGAERVDAATDRAAANMENAAERAGQNIKEGASDATAATGRAVERAGEKIQDASK